MILFFNLLFFPINFWYFFPRWTCFAAAFQTIWRKKSHRSFSSSKTQGKILPRERRRVTDEILHKWTQTKHTLDSKIDIDCEW